MMASKLPEIASIDILHGDKSPTPISMKIEDLYYVRMNQAPGVAAFLREPIQRLRHGCQIRIQYLKRYVFLKFVVTGQPNLSHTSFTQEADEREALR